jgi:hypothetical protein
LIIPETAVCITPPLRYAFYSMRHTTPHGLALPDAVKMVRGALAEYEERFAAYGPMVDWLDGQRAQVAFKVSGVRLTGQIRITPDAVEIEMNPPLVFRLFRKRAVKIIDAEIKRLVENV